MSFPRYPAYKDSGVEWLGEVPEGWNSYPLRSLARPGRDCFIDGDWIESPYITDEGIRLIQTGNIGTGIYREQGFRYISPESFEQLGCTEVSPGDVLICRLAEPVGRACLAPRLGSRMITSVDVAILKPGRQVNPKFLVYALSSGEYLGYMESQCRGGTRDRVSRSFLGSVRIALPQDPQEQAIITTFLDCETAKIDALVADYRTLIELLQEKRQAVISHAVTKGLDPTVPMKHSGVEWLGKVPEHWGVAPIKRLITQIESGVSVNAIDIPCDTDQVGVLKTSSVYSGRFSPDENKTVVSEEINRVACPVTAGTLIVSRMNTPELVGAAGVVKVSLPHIFLPDRLWQIYFQEAESAYIHYWTQSHSYRLQVKAACAGTSSSMQNLSQEDFGLFRLGVPPQEEQSAITIFLDRETAAIDSLITDAEDAISLLQERRTALISAAVTGKIDVRGLVIETPPVAVPESNLAISHP